MSLAYDQFDWGSVIRTLRSQYLWLSQEEFAREVGASTGTVSSWERGIVQPQLRNARRIRELAEANGFEMAEWPTKEVSKPKVVKG